MSHKISFTSTEVSSLKIATAKSGKEYATGFIVDHSEDGKYTTSKSFRIFDLAVIAKLPVELKEFAAKSKDEQKASKASRPRITLVGWLQNKADTKGVWSESLIVTDIQ